MTVRASGEEYSSGGELQRMSLGGFSMIEFSGIAGLAIATILIMAIGLGIRIARHAR